MLHKRHIGPQSDERNLVDSANLAGGRACARNRARCTARLAARWHGQISLNCLNVTDLQLLIDRRQSRLSPPDRWFAPLRRPFGCSADAPDGSQLNRQTFAQVATTAMPCGSNWGQFPELRADRLRNLHPKSGAGASPLLWLVSWLAAAGDVDAALEYRRCRAGTSGTLCVGGGEPATRLPASRGKIAPSVTKSVSIEVEEASISDHPVRFGRGRGNRQPAPRLRANDLGRHLHVGLGAGDGAGFPQLFIAGNQETFSFRFQCDSAAGAREAARRSRPVARAGGRSDFPGFDRKFFNEGFSIYSISPELR